MIYEIIKELQNASGSLAKQKILDENKDNTLLKNYMKAVYDPALSYYMTKLPKGCDALDAGMSTFAQEHIEWVTHFLAKRIVTGHQASKLFASLLSALDDNGRELMSLLIKRSIGAGVGDTMVLKTWPDLYFIPVYQRCSLMDDKIKVKFNSLEEFHIQRKLDGSFLYLVAESSEKPVEAITRAGSKYPTWFAEKLAIGLPNGFVGVGEVEVYPCFGDKETPLLRQEGNGILNSVLKGADETELGQYSFRLTIWDMLTVEEFNLGISTRVYSERLSTMYKSLSNNQCDSIKTIGTQIVSSVDEAYKIYSEFTAAGLEGAVIKNPNSLWKDGTSKGMVKLKIAFEADYVVTGMYEGEGKAKGMLGGLTIATSDGKISCNVGTGFSDVLRKEMWNNPSALRGSIVTIIANDVVTSRNSETSSLFLPVFSDNRFDKTAADDYNRVMEQLNNAKGIK